MNTLPKSLHTVSALVNVARYLQNTAQARDGAPQPAAYWITRAAEIVGYPMASDPHGLLAIAARKLAR